MINLSLNFETVSLGEHLYIKGRIGWKGLKKEEYLDQGDYRIINATALEEEGINWDDCGYISKERFEESPEIILKDKDILISKDGTIGKLGYVKNLEMDSTVASGIFVVRNQNEEYIDTDFLYYYFKSPFFKWFIKSVTEGSVIPHLYQRDFTDMEFNLFDLDTQKKCSSILNAIEEKINVNRKINKNLEEQIETVYNSFFVYYDDFSIEELEECEIGLIPKEWDLLSLGEVTTQIKEKVGNNDYKVFSAVNTGNLILSEDYFDKQVFSKSIEKYIVVKQKEFAYNPARVNIGSIGRNDFDYDGCVSPVYVAFKVEEGYENFVNMFIKSKRFNQWVVTLASGSVRQTLNYTDFSMIKIAYPPKDLIEKFNIIYESYYEVINHNNSMISNLEKIRDILLPKLMSGEIDVSQINCDLE